MEETSQTPPTESQEVQVESSTTVIDSTMDMAQGRGNSSSSSCSGSGKGNKKSPSSIEKHRAADARWRSNMTSLFSVLKRASVLPPSAYLPPEAKASCSHSERKPPSKNDILKEAAINIRKMIARCETLIKIKFEEDIRSGKIHPTKTIDYRAMMESLTNSFAILEKNFADNSHDMSMALRERNGQCNPASCNNGAGDTRLGNSLILRESRGIKRIRRKRLPSYTLSPTTPAKKDAEFLMDQRSQQENQLYNQSSPAITVKKEDDYMDSRSEQENQIYGHCYTPTTVTVTQGPPLQLQQTYHYFTAVQPLPENIPREVSAGYYIPMTTGSLQTMEEDASTDQPNEIDYNGTTEIKSEGGWSLSEVLNGAILDHSLHSSFLEDFNNYPSPIAQPTSAQI